MTTKDEKISGCTATENGQCLYQNIEVERRKSNQRQIDDIETDILKHSGYLAQLLSFMNNVKGQRTILYGVVGLFVTGAFAYTFVSNQALKADVRDLWNDNRTLQLRVSTLDSNFARTDEKYISVIAQIGILNQHLSVLIRGMTDEKNSKSVRLEDGT